MKKELACEKHNRILIGKSKCVDCESRQKILITGHKGFIGSYLFEQLSLRSNYQISGLDIKEGRDINDPIHEKYDIIINCAVDILNKDKMIHTNVAGVENLVKYCKAWKTKLIHFSSVSVYGDSYYGLTKKMGEELIRFWDPKDWLNLRMTNVYQPQGRGDSPACRFSRGEKEIFGDGTHIKDHIHIRDVVRAVLMAIQDNWFFEINLSSGATNSINDIFSRLGQGEPVYLPNKKPDMRVSQLSNYAARQLGWEPSWTISEEPIINPIDKIID